MAGGAPCNSERERRNADHRSRGELLELTDAAENFSTDSSKEKMMRKHFVLTRTIPFRNHESWRKDYTSPSTKLRKTDGSFHHVYFLTARLLGRSAGFDNVR